MIFLILRRVVITLLTLRTCQCDSRAHNFHLSLVVVCPQPKWLRFPGIKKRPASIRPYSLAQSALASQVFFLALFHFCLSADACLLQFLEKRGLLLFVQFLCAYRDLSGCLLKCTRSDRLQCIAL